jgi:hypothetical protein
LTPQIDSPWRALLARTEFAKHTKFMPFLAAILALAALMAHLLVKWMKYAAEVPLINECDLHCSPKSFCRGKSMVFHVTLIIMAGHT